ncbi:MAG: prepilin-type N-terminal cleavage/methylation domain-containing protein [Candidatus Levyibacteriota bacterium]
MKKLTALFKNNRGFTLIELLVVIGILGILAAALIATIDPFEQLKKADDSKIKNIVVEFQTANVRYYTTHSAFPWNDTNVTNLNVNCQGVAALTFPLQLGSGALFTDCIGDSTISNSLIGDGELKPSFSTNTIDLDKIWLNWNSADSTNLIVCFSPTSKSQKAAPDTKYDNEGTEIVDGSCPDANAVDGTCYWCTR